MAASAPLAAFFTRAGISLAKTKMDALVSSQMMLNVWSAELQSKPGSMAVSAVPCCYILGLAAKDHNICDGQAVNP